jgi:hypothetical protein
MSKCPFTHVMSGFWMPFIHRYFEQTNAHPSKILKLFVILKFINGLLNGMATKPSKQLSHKHEFQIFILCIAHCLICHYSYCILTMLSKWGTLSNTTIQTNTLFNSLTGLQLRWERAFLQFYVYGSVHRWSILITV